MSGQNFLLDVLRSHGIEPGSSSVLDIGTGNGKFCLELANIFKDVITIDSNGEAVKKIKEKISSRNISNIKVLHLSAEDLPSLGDNVFNVIIARNSLHFVRNIPKLYDDMKFLLRSHGVFLKISSPLFDLVFTEDSQKSFLINSELKNFTENKFEEELNEYWETEVKENFVKYCDPFRTGKLVFLSSLKQYEFQTSEIIHLMELKEHITDITIVANYISKNGIEQFEEIYQNFLHNIYFLLDIEPCDMYFENIKITRKDTFYVEVQSNKD